MGHRNQKNYNNYNNYNKNKNTKEDSKVNNTKDNLEVCDDVDTNNDSKNANNSDVNKNILEQKDLQIKELEEKYLRVYADFENAKKRLEREKYQSLEYANEGILIDLLPILDTLESAIGGIKNTQDSKESIKNIEDGIKLTIDNFLKVLQKHGISLIDTSGEFDPNIHNAIMQVKDENKEDGEISQVMQKGYKYKERIIRPSMVSITKNN